MKYPLLNKKVLITGASSGIGASAAFEFAKLGALLLLIARNERNLIKVAKRIEDSGGKAKVYPLDIADYREVEEKTKQIKAEVGIPDVIVNNAGSGSWKFVSETSYEEVSSQMSVPYFGAFYITKAFLPDMLRRNSGHIVNMTSYAGFIAFPGATAYIATRTAMVGFHNALTADLNGTNITTSLAYFSKVKSEYWQNNPGSEQRLPKSHKLIPVIDSQRAAMAIVRGVIKRKRKITAPFMIHVMDIIIRCFPFLIRWLMNKTGYKQKSRVHFF